MALFRVAAVQAAQQPAPGVVAWAPPQSRRMIAGLLTSALVLLVAVAMLPVATKVSAAGLVTAGVRPISVPSPTNGRIAFIIAPDRLVASGALLARIDTRRFGPHTQSQGELAVQQLDARGQQLRRRFAAQREVRAGELRQLQARQEFWHQAIEVEDRQLVLLQQRLALADTTLGRAQLLAGSQWISAQTLNQRQQEHLAVRQALAAAQAKRTAARRELGLLDEAVRLHAAQVVEAQADHQLALLELQARIQQLRAGEAQGVPAPVGAMVGEVLARKGQAVRSGDPLLTLLTTHEEPAVVLALPPTGVARIRVGQLVTLRFDAYPYQDYGSALGRIARISPVPRNSAQDAGFQADVRLVRLPAGVVHVPVNTVVRADVRLQRKPLWRWLVDVPRAALARL